MTSHELGLSNIVQVAAGESAAYALAAAGTLYAWGANDFGQLGVGDTDPRLIPTPVIAPSGYRFTSIDADGLGDHVVATVAPTPEPGTIALLSLGALVFICKRRRAPDNAT
jgi:alpha-tubulin suppressor-like RCC1 family protein